MSSLPLRPGKKAWMQAAHQAILELAPQRLKELMETAPSDWDARFVNGKTLLAYAVDRFAFDDDLVAVLLAAGANPNRPISRISSNPYIDHPPQPWTLALTKTSSSRFKMLLAAGAKPQLPSWFWRINPLLTIRQWRDVELLDVALERKWWAAHENILAEVLKWPEEVRAPRLEALLAGGEQPVIASWNEAWWQWVSEGTSAARHWVERFWPQEHHEPPPGWTQQVAFAAAHGEVGLSEMKSVIQARCPPSSWSAWAPSLTQWKIDSSSSASSKPARWSQRLDLIQWALEWGANPNEVDKDKVPALLLILRAAHDSATGSFMSNDRDLVHGDGWKCVESLLLAGASLRRSAPRPPSSSYASPSPASHRHLNVQDFFNAQVLRSASSPLEKWKPRLEACLVECRRRSALTRMLGSGEGAPPASSRCRMTR